MLHFIVDEKQEKEITGVLFDGITSNWKNSYKVKVGILEEREVLSFMTFNSDDFRLRDFLFVQIYVREIEEKKKVLKHKTKKINFSDWTFKGLNLGIFEPNKVYQIEMKFTTKELPQKLSGITSNFDFEFGIKE